MRDFKKWLETMQETISTYTYYTDFEKVYKNVDSIKVELNILNSLIGSKNIYDDFLNLYSKYPEILKAVPILLAKRGSEIKINDGKIIMDLDFNKPNYWASVYANFMQKTGLFDLMSNHIINNLIDYVTGIEVGLDSNARKNRTGDIMEDVVELYLINNGFVKNETYFKEMTKSQIEKRFNIDLSKISNNGKTEKRFDFVFIHNKHIFACECNFYSGGGSKLNETARSYKTLALEAKDIPNFTFIWFTDGIGWKSAKHNLEETFDVLTTVYNINDLNEDLIDELLKENK